MGNMTVIKGGTATATTVSGGNLYVSTDGKASGCNVESNGALYVYSGGEINRTVLNSRGLAYISGGGIAYWPRVSSGGTLTIRSGGETWDTAVNGGVVNVSQGGSAGAVDVLAGTVNVSSGGLASGVMLSSGATVNVFNGGTLANPYGYGNLYVSAGGKVTGTFQMYSDGVAAFDRGSILDFDISEYDPDNQWPCVIDLSQITGTPN